MTAGIPNMDEARPLLGGRLHGDVPTGVVFGKGEATHRVLTTRKPEQGACKQGVWQDQTGVSAFPVLPDRAGVGLTGSRQTMFYAEVTDAQREGPGGGVAEEGELIEVVHLSLDDAQAFADNPDIPKTLGVIFAISWFFGQVVPRLTLQ